MKGDVIPIFISDSTNVISASIVRKIYRVYIIYLPTLVYMCICLYICTHYGLNACVSPQKEYLEVLNLQSGGIWWLAFDRCLGLDGAIRVKL